MIAAPVRTANDLPCVCPIREVIHEKSCEWAARERELWGHAIDLLTLDVMAARIRQSERTLLDGGGS